MLEKKMKHKVTSIKYKQNKSGIFLFFKSNKHFTAMFDHKSSYLMCV